MAILKPSYSVVSTLTIPGLATLANTASATETAEHDNTTDLFVDVEINLTFTTGAAGTSTVDVYVLDGIATGVISTTAKTSNMRRLGSVELNGTTAVAKTLTYNDVKPFWKLHFINNSGAALTSETVTMRGVNFTDV